MDLMRSRCRHRVWWRENPSSIRGEHNLPSCSQLSLPAGSLSCCCWSSCYCFFHHCRSHQPLSLPPLFILSQSFSSIHKLYGAYSHPQILDRIYSIKHMRFKRSKSSSFKTRSSMPLLHMNFIGCTEHDVFLMLWDFVFIYLDPKRWEETAE